MMANLLLILFPALGLLFLHLGKEGLKRESARTGNPPRKNNGFTLLGGICIVAGAIYMLVMGLAIIT